MANQAAAAEARPFGMRDKVGYAFGDIANDFTFILASSFLLKFYTDVMGVAAGVIGVVMMAVRLVDAVIDVSVGRIVDTREPTKEGKFRPWILKGSIFVAVMSVLMYPTFFAGMGEGFKIVWLVVSYLLYSAMYSVVNIPYGSMASAISDKNEHRTQLSVFRSAGATIASLVISVTVPMFAYYTDAAGNTAFSGSQFQVIVIVCSVLAFVSYLVCYFGTTERVKIPKAESKGGNPLAFVGKLIHNRPFVAYCGFTICVILAQFTLTTMANYIFPNYYGSASAQSMAMLLGSVATLAFSMIATPLANKFGKKEIASVGVVMAAAMFLICFLLRPENVVVFSVFFVLGYLGMGMMNVYLFAIVVDIIDADEIDSGVREDGTIYSSYSFFRKLAQSLSSALTGGLLSAIGYTAATAFDPEVLEGIFNITTLTPAILFALGGLIVIFAYPLNKGTVDANAAELAKRRAK